jgi:N-acyl-D-aspartate/D-glutamate deacylase
LYVLAIFIRRVVSFDVIIRNGLWFDGTGRCPQVRTLGIRNGVVETVVAGPIDETDCPDVIDAHREVDRSGLRRRAHPL